MSVQLEAHREEQSEEQEGVRAEGDIGRSGSYQVPTGHQLVNLIPF